MSMYRNAYVDVAISCFDRITATIDTTPEYAIKEKLHNFKKSLKDLKTVEQKALELGYPYDEFQVINSIVSDVIQKIEVNATWYLALSAINNF